MTNFWQKLQQPFLCLAPMEDVTDFVFREIVATHLPRPDVFFTEFTSADGLASEGYEKTVHRLKFGENQRPIVAQIWGTNPQNMYQAAKIVADLEFDGVDINMGCPDRNIMKKGAGAAMCTDMNLAGEIIDAVKRGSKGLPVSVKTRIGFNKVVTDEWIPFLLKQKIAALTIHGRIAKQMSKGQANWDEIAKAVIFRDEIAPKTLIVGNGDILSFKSAADAHRKYNVDGVMIGRGIFKNPWVFSKSSKEHSKEEYLDVLQKHMELYVNIWGEQKNFHIMKKFFKMYVNNFPGAAKLRDILMQCNTLPQVERILRSSL